MQILLYLFGLTFGNSVDSFSEIFLYLTIPDKNMSNHFFIFLVQLFFKMSDIFKQYSDSESGHTEYVMISLI